MKKVFRLFLILTAVMLCLTAYAEPVSVSAPGVSEARLTGLTVHWSQQNGYYILTAAWKEQGHEWEACLTGLPEKLSADQIRLLLSAAVLGRKAEMTGGGLIDAEKASNRIPLTQGKKLVKDKISRQYEWGDSQHCWAAAVSNMLELTGWIRQAAETDTGRGFEGTDDLFGFFNRAFVNEGAHFSAALDWVFSGSVTEEMAEPRKNIQGPLIRDAERQAVYSDLRADECGTVYRYLELLSSRLAYLKQGAAIGISISICPIDYPLKSDPKTLVSHDSERDGYVSYEYPTVSKSEVRKTAFVPDARNGLPIPVTYDPADGTYREERSGAKVDESEVWIGGIVYDSEQDLWFSIYEDPYSDEDSDPTYIRYVFHDKDELDFEHPVEHAQFGGQHAVTVMGYVKDLSEKETAARVKALILANSDNDAEIYRPDQNNVRREDRPNRYTLYPTEIILTEKGNLAFSLKDYLIGDQILPYSLTVLMPPDEETPPRTGDAFPLALYAALPVLCVCILTRLYKKRRS